MDEKYIKLTQEWYSRGYEAGAQSRQAEIDELQKRIDETIELINSCFNPSKKSIIDILKGNKND